MGGSGNDRLAGRSGNDKLYGDARSPSAGPPGNDELAGGSGADLLVGGPGDDLIQGAYDGDRILAGTGNDVINLLGGDTTDPNGRAYVDCGRGFDVVAINPARRGVYRNCEAFTSQFHEADFGHFYHPSSEVWPPGVPNVVPARPLGGRVRSRRSHSPQAAPCEAASVRTALPPRPDGGAGAPSISADGRFVGYSSDADNLVASATTNGARTDPFVRDMDTGQNMLADSQPLGRHAESRRPLPPRSGRRPQRGRSLRGLHQQHSRPHRRRAGLHDLPPRPLQRPEPARLPGGRRRRRQPGDQRRRPARGLRVAGRHPRRRATTTCSPTSTGAT